MFGRKPAAPTAPTRFGEAAIKLGLAQPADVQKALRIQAHRQRSDQPVPLLGEVLRGLGVLTDAQIDTVFSHLLEGEVEPAPTRKSPVKPATARTPPVVRTAAKASARPAAAGWWDRLKSLAG